ncbi:hypothetical protein [Corynebacterium flavescens]|uniref:Scaffolding protein n=1 Tax=Corynebacterium flavescens TaxID=28028 RepID=A0AB73B892_CORFL|nr:hypothetical protein [Corynebacterium flavescens]KAA8720469.1 hypothetical protein F4V60_09210 [Corynebacterium flavescens]GEB97770.1 hypothetical protein CFL01nite_12650 [Corynebacterium flavescens]
MENEHNDGSNVEAPQTQTEGESNQHQQTTDTAGQELTNTADAVTKPEENQGDYDAKISKLNAEAAKWRTKFREQEESSAKLQSDFEAYKGSVAKAIGLADENPTPEELVKQWETKAKESEDRYTQLVRRTALNEAITKAKADPTLTVPFVRGSEAFAALDPTADDYAAQVTAIVEQAVENTPKLRAQVAPTSSGNAPTPNDNSAHRYTLEDVDKMNEYEIYELNKQGKLDHLFKEK